MDYIELALSDSGLTVSFKVFYPDGELKYVGNLKWDGCIDLRYTNLGNVHYCDYSEVLTFAQEMNYIYTESRDLIISSQF